MLINDEHIECGGSLTTENSDVGVKCHIERLTVRSDVILLETTSVQLPRKMRLNLTRDDTCLYSGTTQSLHTPLQHVTSISCILETRECNVLVYRAGMYLFISSCTISHSIHWQEIG